MGAMQRLWVLISPDRLVISAAFTALIIAAVSDFLTLNYCIWIYSLGQLQHVSGAH